MSEDEEDAVDYELLKRLGLSMESFTQTEGKQVVENFDEIMNKLADPTFSVATRVEMADMFSNWHHLGGEESKNAIYMSEKANRIFEVIKTLIPTKDVKVASSLTNGISTTLTMTEHGQTMAPNVVDSMRMAMGLPIAASKPLKPDGEPQFRATCVTGLISCIPYVGIKDASQMPEDSVDIIASFISYNDPPCAPVQQSAYGSLSMLALYNADLFTGHLGPIFKAIRVHSTSSSILGQIKGGFEADPQSYIDNLDYFFEIGIQTSFSIIQQIGTSDALALTPYVNKIRDIAKNDSLYGTSAMTWMKQIAVADESGSKVPLEMVEDMYETGFKGNGAEYTYAMLVGACRQEPDRTIQLLVRMLQDPRLQSQASSVILNELNNLKDDSSGPSFFEPFMPTIMSFEPSNAALVQQIEDWAAGRSLENLSERVGVVEARIDELNQKVHDSCKNFDEVMLYMDDHIDELKEFVATVAKKLPTPTRITVVSGLKKTIKLHFPCCRQHPPCTSPYGDEYTVETREWNKWLKIGFTACKLGKVVIDIGMGNPLGLVRTGIDAIGDIYAAYKSKDDEEFNNYITNPFLSNAEQDKLLEQLRDYDFFDAFEYDAQVASWYCFPCAPFPGQSLKMIEMEEAGLTGYGSRTDEKGKYLNMKVEDGIELAEMVYTDLVVGEDEEEEGEEEEEEEEEEVDKLELAHDTFDLVTEMREDYAEEEGDEDGDDNEPQEEPEEPEIVLDASNQKLSQETSKKPSPAAPNEPSPHSAAATLRAKEAKIRALKRNVRELEMKTKGHQSAVPEDKQIALLKRQVVKLEERVSQLEAKSPGAQCCAIS